MDASLSHSDATPGDQERAGQSEKYTGSGTIVDDIHDQSENSAIRARAEALYRTVEEAILHQEAGIALTDEVQSELGSWINIVSVLVGMVTENKSGTKWWSGLSNNSSRPSVDPADMLARAELAVHLLLKSPGTSLSLAHELRYEIRNDLSWNGGPFQRLLIRATGGSSSMTVALGALCTTVIGLVLIGYVLAQRTGTLFHLHPQIIVGTTVPAFLGAVVSILARLRDFDTSRNADLKLLFLTAFFKPYIGMITGLFIVSALAIGIGQVQDINLAPASQENWPTPKVFYLLYVVGFLAGFSERLATDFIDMAEERLSGPTRSKPT